MYIIEDTQKLYKPLQRLYKGVFYRLTPYKAIVIFYNPLYKTSHTPFYYITATIFSATTVLFSSVWRKSIKIEILVYCEQNTHTFYDQNISLWILINKKLLIYLNKPFCTSLPREYKAIEVIWASGSCKATQFYVLCVCTREFGHSHKVCVFE